MSVLSSPRSYVQMTTTYKEKNEFFSNRVSPGIQTTLKEGLIPINRWPRGNEHNVFVKIFLVSYFSVEVSFCLGGLLLTYYSFRFYVFMDYFFLCVDACFLGAFFSSFLFFFKLGLVCSLKGKKENEVR